MSGGAGMSDLKRPQHSYVKLSGEEGKKTFYKILNSKPDQYDAKAASKKAHKFLRKQGFYM